jgi:hypothetical protein
MEGRTTATIMAVNVSSTVFGFGDDVSMPEYIMDRLLYMHKTSMSFPQLPPVYQDYLIPVKQMLKNIKPSELPIYITIDEKHLKAGEYHRKPGIHVDYNWYEKNAKHGKGAHGHKFVDNPKGGMLIATNHMSAWAYSGIFSGDMLPGGDCSLIDLKANFLAAVPITENQIFFLGSTCIHEPLPVQFAINRQLIRINLHPDYGL